MANMTTQEILQGIKDWAAPKVIYDISAAHNNTKYTDLSDALGTNGGNIPQEYRKGGITVRYVRASDNKYIQARCMAQNFTTDVAQWQGVDDILTAGSKNLTESAAIIDKFFDFTLLTGFNATHSKCLSNFKYFICKKPEIISTLAPRICIIYNSNNEHRIAIFKNDDTAMAVTNSDGPYEDENFAFEYDWSKHDPSVYINNLYPEAKIGIVSSSYSQAFSNLLNTRCTAIETNVATNVAKLQTIDNSQRFYDTTAESYASDSIAERRALILEMYVDGEPFSNENPLEIAKYFDRGNGFKRLTFVRKNEDLWAFSIDKATSYNGISLEKVSYDNKNIYLVINWGAPYITYKDVHSPSRVIVSNGCYSLDNNPAISAYIKNLSFINNLSTFPVNFTKLYSLSEMGTMYHHGKFLDSGIIKMSSAASPKYGTIFVPIAEKETLKICISNVLKVGSYDNIAFCKNTETHSSYDAVLNAADIIDTNNLEYNYFGIEDGYVAIFVRSDLSLDRLFKGNISFEDIKPLVCSNQLPTIDIKPLNNETIVQNNQDAPNTDFTGKVSEIETVTPHSSGGSTFYIMSDPFTDANDKLRSYADEDGMIIYPVKLGCRVLNNNSHNVNFNFGFRYRTQNSWVTPEISKPIGANSYEDFELVLYIDLRTVTATDLGLYAYFANAQVGDTFTIGNTYYRWYDIKHRDVNEWIDPSHILPGIQENQLSQELQDKINNNNSHLYPALQKKIICSGSSITWGSGKLDDSMVLYVDKFIKEKLSETLLPEQMTFPDEYTEVSNALMYNGYGRKISNIGDTIEFDSYGDEIAICQMKRRSKTDYGVVNVYADNTLIGTFDNKNFIKNETETFSGSNIRDIRLKHPCTFNHVITINGSTTLSRILYNTTNSTSGTVPSDQSSFDAFVFRALDDNGNPVHKIQFSTALGTITSVSISYDYGNIVAHERSTRGQTSDEYTNESCYGEGSISYDPAQPTSGLGSGLEFRAINKNAFFIHKFTSVKMRHFKLELVGGNNPYFIINYVTNRYHDLMNAGIGGWSILQLINDDKKNDYTQFFKWFKPEIIFQESETNDDWTYETRRIRRSIGEITLAQLRELPWLEIYSVEYNQSTDKYAVDMCTGYIDSITPTSLISQHIVGTQTQIGDIIRIGNYHGDIKQITCRRITEVNLQTGEVKWVEPISVEDMLNVDTLQDLVGAEINIRDLSDYKTSYKTYIEKVHEVTPEAKIIIVDNGLPMLGARQLWGYDIIHREILNESQNVAFLDAREVLYNGQFDTISGARKETIIANGGNEYTLSFAGTHNSWCGFKVLVNGVDVYGKDCYIQSMYAWRAKSTLSGTQLNKTTPYNNYRSQTDLSNGSSHMKLVFTRNAPTVNDTVEVWYSDEIWSSDYCHPASFGGFLYGQAYSKIIEK